MMGRSHLATGLAAGAALAALLDLAPMASCLAALVTGGYALLPDLDHPEARASRLAGPVSRAVSSGVRVVSRRVYLATRSRCDERLDGEHRALTHTVAFAVWVASCSWLSGWLAGGAGLAAVVGLGLWLAADCYRRLAGPALAVASWWLATSWLAVDPDAGLAASSGGGSWLAVGPAASQWWLAVCAGLGCLVHTLGDAVTVSGVPLWWPVRVRGRAWHRVRPRRLRLRTGGVWERRWVEPGAWVFAVVAMAVGVVT